MYNSIVEDAGILFLCLAVLTRGHFRRYSKAHTWSVIKENSYIVNCLPSQSVSSAAPMFNGTQWITVLLPQWLTVLLQNHTGCCVGEAVLTGCCVGEALLILLLFYTLFLAVGAISLSSTVRLTNHARMLPLSAQPVSMQNWSHSLNSQHHPRPRPGDLKEF